MLKITHPSAGSSEWRYILDVVFKEFLGVQYQALVGSEGGIKIEAEGKSLYLPDIFLSKADGVWLKEESLPSQPLRAWDSRELGCPINLTKPTVPVIFGKGFLVESTEDRIVLGVDLLGSVFFMISRYEEAVRQDRDEHDRFPSSASLAFQEGFLDRPIVNEYLELLWLIMKRLWPSIKRKPRSFRIRVSADVDVPYSPGIKSLKRMVRMSGGHIIRRRDPLRALNEASNYVCAKLGSLRLDWRYRNFSWMMDVNEALGNRVVFYFIADRSSREMDGCYDISEPHIQKLMKTIHDRGHEVGLHTSYNSYLDAYQTRHEADRLRQTFETLGIRQDYVGVRQHYLRWRTSETADHLEKASLDYDSTLSFADHVGFRCGTCYEYPLYNVNKRHALKIKEVPLTAMEASIFEQRYMGMRMDDEGVGILESIKSHCKRYSGDFTILWHNNQLLGVNARGVYQTVIR